MLIVIDLEATCFDEKEKPKESEIIEIGAVLLDDDLSTMGTFQTFVFPDRNPVLSDFCKKLTTITQTQVTIAPKFPDALKKFLEWIKSTSGKDVKDIIFCSWGFYDKNQFEHDCKQYDLAYPFGEHLNISLMFRDLHKTKKCGVKKALGKLAMKFEGTPHRGIDDAINISRIMIKLNEKFGVFKINNK